MNSAVSDIAGLVGLDRARRTVTEIIRQSSPVGAVLIFGAPRSGKSTLARYLAQSWMCLEGENPGPCRECKVCRSFEVGRAVDFQTISPFGPGNLIKIRAISEGEPRDKDFEGVPVITYLRTRPLMAKSKVILLQNIDRMTSEASNSLLKTLEELPPYGKIIMTTSHVGKVIPTIRSRCFCLACEVPDSGAQESSGPAHLFAQTPGDLRLIEANVELFNDLELAIRGIAGAPVGAALKLSLQWRALADRFMDLGCEKARQAQVMFFSFAAIGLLRLFPERPDYVHAVVHASQWIEANGQANLIFDDLLIKLLL